jgi:hypothetical protein
VSNNCAIKMPRSGFIVSLAMALAGHALCQNPETADPRECLHVAERLGATSDRDKAWGAHSAAACRTPGLAEEIVAQLNRSNPDMSGRTIWGESQWAVNAMLDALIQLHQPLEASALTSIAKHFPTEATILMLQDAPKNRSLLATVREMPVSHSVWVAASNALARLRAAGFAAALLREVSLTTSVFVLDPGKTPHGSGGSGMLSNSNMQLPPGFPPVAVYWLTAEWADGEELVSNGPTPIYSQRTVIDPGMNRQINWPSDAYCVRCKINCPECQRERAEYLAGLAQVPTSEVHRLIQPQLIVEWSTPAHVDAEISRGLAEQEAGIRRLVRLLASVGALHNSELGMMFHIEIRTEDQRSDRSVPLTEYPAVEFRVE